MRLYMVSTYGGIWCDATVILTKSLDWMLTRADFVGFHMDGWQSQGKPEAVLVLELWSPVHTSPGVKM